MSSALSAWLAAPASPRRCLLQALAALKSLPDRRMLIVFDGASCCRAVGPGDYRGRDLPTPQPLLREGGHEQTR
jgi:hypothetical protein